MMTSVSDSLRTVGDEATGILNALTRMQENTSPSLREPANVEELRRRRLEVLKGKSTTRIRCLDEGAGRESKYDASMDDKQDDSELPSTSPNSLSPIIRSNSPDTSSSQQQPTQSGRTNSPPERPNRRKIDTRASYEKVSDILGYLDEIDTFPVPVPMTGTAAANSSTSSAVLTPSPSRIRSPSRSSTSKRRASRGGLSSVKRVEHFDWETESEVERMSQGSLTRRTTNIGAVYGDVKSKLVAMTVELEDKSRTLSALKKALDRSRQDCKSITKAAEERERAALKALREDYETAIARHLSFIDRLLSDKETLSGKCDQLTAQLKELESSYSKRMEDLNNAHVMELKKTRESWAAMEKVRRERWETEKTAEIKSITVQGLEPEIQRILNKHKDDCRALEERASKELRACRKRASERRETEISALRDRMMKERAEVVASERTLAEARARETTERYEAQIQEIRKSWLGEAEAERRRHDEGKREIERRRDAEIAKIREDHATEMKVLRQTVSEERDKAMKRFDEQRVKERREETLERERILREEREVLKREFEDAKDNLHRHLEKETANEIDVVVKRLDEETTQAQRRAAAEYEQRLQELERTHAAGLRKARESEGSWMRKYSELMKSNEMIQRARAQEERENGKKMARLQEEMRRAKEEADQAKEVVGEREKALRREYAEKRSSDLSDRKALSREVRDLRTSLAKAQDEYAKSLSGMQRRKENDLDQVRRHLWGEKRVQYGSVMFLYIAMQICCIL